MALVLDFIHTLIEQEHGLLILFLIGFTLGAAVIWLIRGRRLKHLLADNQELAMTLRLERQSNEQLDELLDQTRFQL